jgi:acetyl esterase/lipase
MLFSTLIVVGMLASLAPERQSPRPSEDRVELDIPYAEGGDEQKLDLFLPRQKNFAIVVFTYGGGWHRGSRKSVTPIGEKLQSLGYGCALLSHGLSPQDKFPAQIEDVAAAFAWVKKNIIATGPQPNEAESNLLR